MFEINLKIAYLLDFYSEALDEHVRNVLTSYYEGGLSLAEIASDVGISRQGIRHLIKKGEEQLEFFESKFHLAERYNELLEAKENLTLVYNKLCEEERFNIEADAVKRAIEIISKGNQDVRESN